MVGSDPGDDGDFERNRLIADVETEYPPCRIDRMILVGENASGVTLNRSFDDYAYLWIASELFQWCVHVTTFNI